MGPLAGIKIIEIAGLGPCPMCAMLLAELGATVLRIDRKEPVELGLSRPLRFDLLRRSRKSIPLDLKSPDATELVLQLVEGADALIEGFRPGVAERLGLGPERCLERNSRLVYGRVTGWGQSGPLKDAAGHDLNYIAITGVLNAIGRRGQPPSIPLNLVGDFGGGALYLALGVVAGILEARQSGRGQVVDAAMVDGAASLATMFLVFKRLVCSARSAAPTRSTQDPISATSTNARTDAGWRYRRLKAGFMLSSFVVWGLIGKSSAIKWTARLGRTPIGYLARNSKQRHAMNGACCWKEPTLALPPCCHGLKPHSMRICASGVRSLRWMVSCSQHLHRVSAVQFSMRRFLHRR